MDDSLSKKGAEYWRKDVADLREDSVHGSIVLAKRALDIIEEYIRRRQFHNRTELLQSLSKLSNSLIRAKPLMALIFNRSQYIIRFIKKIPKENKNIESITELALEEIKLLRSRIKKNFKIITKYGARTVLDHNVILTHSSSSQVEAIFIEARRMNRRFRVICPESRPLNEGSELAFRLAKEGIKTTIIPEADIIRGVQAANYVITGTDRITETSFVNKTGTHAIALAAAKFHKPFYLVGEIGKILLKRTYPVRFGEAPPSEITPKKHPNLTIQNLYFEEIPIELVGKLIVEDGIFELKEFVDRYL